MADQPVSAARDVVRAALIRARYPLGGYPDPINPDEDRVPYDLMAVAVVVALREAGLLREPSQPSAT